MTNVEDRIRGCMFGLAIGDALGAPVEFKERDTFPIVKDYLPIEHYNLPPGSWTDDTSMALCLAQSLIDCGEFDAEDQLLKYTAWYKSGYMSVNGQCFDIGNTTRMAIESFTDTSCTISPYSGSDYSGNGSIMRLAPIPIFYRKDDYIILRDKARKSSETTHSSNLCKAACLDLAKTIYRYLNGHAKNTVVDSTVKELPRRRIRSTGFVIDTLQAAYWSFMSTDSFEECVLTAVNLGDDADTIGAIAGSIAGAYYGYNSIPDRFIDGLQKADLIDRITTSLYVMSENK